MYGLLNFDPCLSIYSPSLGLFQFVRTVGDGAVDSAGETDDELPGQRPAERPEGCGPVTQRDPGDTPTCVSLSSCTNVSDFCNTLFDGMCLRPT